MNQVNAGSFRPPFGLGHRHLQTILGSSLRKVITTAGHQSVRQCEVEQIVETKDGAKLAIWVSEQSARATTIVIIHGWLGTHNSSYSLSLAERLWQAGFNVVRLNLRDHGGTAHLNEGMFHNGLIDEVIDVVEQLLLMFKKIGVAGFSLGGNFALRIAKRMKLPVLGVCPLMDPELSVSTVDSGWVVYKKYFMKKWLGALDEKMAAFPNIYDFDASGARQLTSVSAMTEHFVSHYTEYDCLQDYYDCYTLSGDFLAGTSASILMAKDDPVVPFDSFARLPASIEVTSLNWGGHCGFIDSYKMTSYVDSFALEFFKSAFR